MLVENRRFHSPIEHSKSMHFFKRYNNQWGWKRCIRHRTTSLIKDFRLLQTIYTKINQRPTPQSVISLTNVVFNSIVHWIQWGLFYTHRHTHTHAHGAYCDFNGSVTNNDAFKTTLYTNSAGLTCTSLQRTCIFLISSI